MKKAALLSACALALLAGCGGGTSARKIVTIGSLRCVLPGADVSSTTTLSGKLRVGAGSSGSTTESTESAPAGEGGELTIEQRIQSILSVLSLEAERSIEFKRERLARMTGKSAEMDVITYKLCEAAGNGLIEKKHYQEFLRLTLQKPPPASF
ncbi:MAG: hypothetical protein V3V62_05310 [bacterium]